MPEDAQSRSKVPFPKWPLSPPPGTPNKTLKCNRLRSCVGGERQVTVAGPSPQFLQILKTLHAQPPPTSFFCPAKWGDAKQPPSSARGRGFGVGGVSEPRASWGSHDLGESRPLVSESLASETFGVTREALGESFVKSQRSLPGRVRSARWKPARGVRPRARPIQTLPGRVDARRPPRAPSPASRGSPGVPGGRADAGRLPREASGLGFRGARGRVPAVFRGRPG